MTTLVHVDHLQKIYHARGGVAHTALAGVSFTLDAGTFVAVMGPSGCGKTTLLNLIAGLDTPTAGSIALKGQRLDTLSEAARAQLRRTALGFVFQDDNLLDPLTVEENVLLPLTLEHTVGKADLARVHEVLTQLGLFEYRQRFPFELSGGQQQLVAIARAIVHRPLLLLADEPTGNLDSGSSRMVLETFAGLHATEQTTIFMVTHDPFAASYAERVLLMKDGQLYAELRRGTDERAVFYQRVIDALSSLEGALA
jgi:ABC-type lipoprotein export system ATPase subunit